VKNTWLGIDMDGNRLTRAIKAIRKIVQQRRAERRAKSIWTKPTAPLRPGFAR
jgi:hypothetical protein